MKQNRPKTRWNLILILVIFGAISYSGYKYLMPKPKKADIFAISQVALKYGETSISGVLQKDSPIGASGSFILILPDSRPITLDVKGLDNLLGMQVKISGILLPADQFGPMFMQVKTITNN